MDKLPNFPIADFCGPSFMNSFKRIYCTLVPKHVGRKRTSANSSPNPPRAQ